MKVSFKDLQTGEAVFERSFNPSQEAFWKAPERFVLISGGIGSGKSMVMILKTIYDAMSQNNNYILMGRTRYQEIHDVLLKDFFELCHDSWIKEYRKTPHPAVVLHTFNGGTSEIIFRNLDKFSKSEILGLNLGGISIDQAEDIPEEIFLALKGRLRRPNINHKVYLTSNPKLSWLYRAFKQEPEDNYKLIEVSTFENEKNLPKEYIEDLKKYPKSWIRQYVEGIWDESLLSDNTVFAREHIEQLVKHLHAPLKEREGLKVYKEYIDGHRYQVGIDAAEGADMVDGIQRDNDFCVVKIWDHTTHEEVASYSAKVAPRVLAEKAVLFASWYKNPLMVPEMNSIGVALLDKLDELGYMNIFQRKEYDRSIKKNLKKLGWRTTAATKQLLIARFEEKLRLVDPKVRSKSTHEQFKTFVYSNEAKKRGAGAMDGFHDDEVMALLLAAYDEGDVPLRVASPQNHGTIISNGVVPSVTVVNGKFRPDGIFKKEHVAKWTTL